MNKGFIICAILFVLSITLITVSYIPEEPVASYVAPDYDEETLIGIYYTDDSQLNTFVANNLTYTYSAHYNYVWIQTDNTLVYKPTNSNEVYKWDLIKSIPALASDFVEHMFADGIVYNLSDEELKDFKRLMTEIDY